MRPEPPPSGGKFRILIVEDDQNIARLMLTNLSRAGFDCRHAADGNLGWEAFEASDPHLVLLDLMMPGMSGAQLCAKIRETSTIPIIMMTALSSEENQMQGLKMGADDYVPKPFNPKLLVARTVSWLRRVYRYDAPIEEEIAAAVVPEGWATCEACSYMGPRQKFERTSAGGNTSLLCPYCKQSEFIAFSVV